MAFSMVLAVIGIVVCMRGIYRCGRSDGFESGMELGAAIVLKDMCDGYIHVDEGCLHIDKDAAFGFKNGDGEFVTDLDVESLHFEEG